MQSSFPARATRQSVRLPELDLLRFAAACAVVVYHYTYRPAINGAIDEQAYGGFQTVSRFGYLGVDLFFMISGFVILWSAQSRTANEFAISRVARLYPSFWICVPLTAFVVNYLGTTPPLDLRTVLLNLTMIPSRLGAEYVDGVYWTLFVEIKFYVLVYLALLFGVMRYVNACLLVWLCASLACAAGVAPRWVESISLFPFGASFISGCLFYLIRAGRSSALEIAALLISGTLAVRCAIGEQADFMKDVNGTTDLIVGGLIVLFHLLFWTLVMLPTKMPASPVWHWLGSMTYPLYLLHNRIEKVLFARLYPSMPLWACLAMILVGVFSIVALIAAVVERRVCGRFNRWLLLHAMRFKLVSAPVVGDSP